jgi:hypothetical protein
VKRKRQLLKIWNLVIPKFGYRVGCTGHKR